MAGQLRDPTLRQRIIDSAFRLIARGGLAAATMRAIATETRVSTGSVTHYFQDKAEIVAAVLSDTNRHAAMRVTEAVAGRRGLDALHQAALAMLPIDEERVDTWRLWIAFWPDEFGSRGSGFANRYRQWHALMSRCLSEAVADGDLPAGVNIRAEADGLSTLIAGFGLLSGTDLATEERFLERVERMLADHFATLARTR